MQRIAPYPKITVTEGGRGVYAAAFNHGFGYHPLLAWLDNIRVDDFGVVDEPVDHGRGDDLVAEDFAPTYPTLN